MLLRFRFSNFRSFREEQELSLVAVSAFKETHPTAITHPPSMKDGVLPVAAIYGANASGKTNIIRALDFASQAVKNSHSRWEPDGPIPLDPFLEKGIKGTPESSFEFDFLIKGIRHSYGFRLNAMAITEEWLFVYPNSKKQSWFHRHRGKPIAFSAKMPGPNKLIEAITRKNSLFLSAAAQNNHEALMPPFEWLSGLRFVRNTRTSSTVLATEVLSKPRLAAVVVRLLRAADVGVADVRVEKEPGAIAILNLEGYESVERIRLLHQIGAERVPFEEENESAGTNAFLRVLGPVLRAVNEGGVLCKDELDASLHPLLAGQIVQLFNDPSSNRKGAQLIFNTHDATLLNRANLRRDQIWFTEKGKDGASHLYPLTDYKPRQNENLETGYLQGRYGAIPFLNPRDFLVERTNGKA